MIKPVRDFIAVEKPEENTKTASGLYMAPSLDDKIVIAKVVAVGSGQIAADGKRVELEVNVNDSIAFNKTMTVEVKANGKTYLLLREENVLCVVN